LNLKWTDFRLDAFLADTMLTKLYATGPNYFTAFKLNRHEAKATASVFAL
jgi:hypothetical protein